MNRKKKNGCGGVLDLSHGSTSSLLLFILPKELINGKIGMKDARRKRVIAEDLILFLVATSQSSCSMMILLSG